ncbi:plasmid replication, integration and excision activator [Thermocatellispora tengchongensis]|uniref:plasmid replication, integration and excision activator n=1 Tax=Thermocatellispora tengchongensis TaxID=1073253 RepID=UPI0031E72DF1
MTQEMVFPHGCFVVGDVTPVFDFDASTRERQVQARDKTTGEPVWSVPVMDGDPSVKAASKTMAIKFVGNPPKVPAPPAGLAGLPVIPVEFDGLTVTPYVNGSNRLAYSFRATGIRAAAVAASKGKAGPKDGQ